MTSRTEDVNNLENGVPQSIYVWRKFHVLGYV